MGFHRFLFVFLLAGGVHPIFRRGLHPFFFGRGLHRLPIILSPLTGFHLATSPERARQTRNRRSRPTAAPRQAAPQQSPVTPSPVRAQDNWQAVKHREPLPKNNSRDGAMHRPCKTLHRAFQQGNYGVPDDVLSVMTTRPPTLRLPNLYTPPPTLSAWLYLMSTPSVLVPLAFIAALALI